MLGHYLTGKLRKATTLSDNQKLTVKLNTAVASKDAHSIDIKYHKNCWLNSVTNICISFWGPC